MNAIPSALSNPVPVDVGDVRAAIQEAASQAAQLIQSIPETRAPARGLGWTVGETAAHLVTGLRLYTDWATGRDRPDWGVDEIAVNNARFIGQIPEVSATALADDLVEAAHDFLAATADLPGDQPFPWYEGQTLRLTSALCIVLGELLVHGYDIARSVGRTWPIDPRQARLVIAGGLIPALPLFVNSETARGVKATYDVRLRGGPRFIARFDDGGLTIAPADSRPVDCHILADPVAFLLVGYGRLSQWGPIARGRLLAWGRKPWLGFQFTSLLKKP